VVNVGSAGTLSVRVSGVVVNVAEVEVRWVQVPTPTSPRHSFARRGEVSALVMALTS
jgi:hypothetical protein